MLTKLLTVLFSGLVWQQTSLADESFGYVVLDGSSNISCATNPIPGECSFQHEVAFSKMTLFQNRANVSSMKNALQTALEGAENSTTELCVATAHEYFCKMAFPLTCKEEYIVLDIAGGKKSCETAEKNCMNVTGAQSFMLQTLINCSTSMEPVQPIKRQPFQCGHFPDVQDDPYTCARRNYKVLSSNLTEQARTQVAQHQMLVKNARNISQKCLNDVSEVICKTVALACDRNETMIVSFLSKQECERIISCVNITLKGKNLTEFQKMCTNLPDENTAEKLPLSHVYITFENNTISNDTKMRNRTSTTTRRPAQSKATDSRSLNSTGELYSAKTEEPYQNTTMKPTTILSKSTPMIEANLTKTNKKVKLTTEKPMLNTTSKVKSASSPKPTTEMILNYTLQDQLSTKLTKTPPDVVGHVNATTGRPFVTHPSLNVSVNSQDQSSTKLTKTPQLNGTASLASRPVFTNVTNVFNMTVARPSFSVSGNCSNSTSPNCNKAQNTRINGLVVLAISILSIWTWQ